MLSVRWAGRPWGSDTVTYAAQYGSVVDWVGPTGTILNDPAAITALYTFLFSNVFAGTTRVSTIRNLTFLSGTIAVLDIETEVIGFARALEKNVLIKRAGVSATPRDRSWALLCDGA